MTEVADNPGSDPHLSIRAHLDAGRDLVRALGAHLNLILELARDAANHRRLAQEASTPELRDAQLAQAAMCQRRIEQLRWAQYWSLEAIDPSFATEPPRKAA